MDKPTNEASVEFVKEICGSRYCLECALVKVGK